MAFVDKILKKELYNRHKKDEVTEWKQLHSEELHNLYSSPNIWLDKSSRMRWV
jgi:hypothetical protein